MPASAWTFHPSRVLFEQASLDYPLGRRLWDRFAGAVNRGVAEVRIIPSHNRVTGLPGQEAGVAYLEAKRTLVVSVRRGLDFASCRPSADYQLPLVTSCPGLCEYCYLQTTLGRRPYVRVYVNVEDILNRVGELARAGGLSMADRPISFEGAAVGDPVPVEPLTGALAEAVRFFALQENARFRFVTKFPDVDGLLGLDHRGQTRARVTLNTERVIRDFDHGTPPLETRLDTLARLTATGYPTGVMIAPVFLEGDWRREYEAFFERLGRLFGPVRATAPDLTLEVVTHRFTATARRIILERYPESRLPMGEEGRVQKRGQFGYFKSVYPKAQLDEARVFFTGLAARYLPEAAFDYLV